MRTTALSAIVLTVLASAAGSVAAQMKPGLWEMTMTSDAIKNMPKLPPEQIEQMRKMGVSIPQNGGITSKVCVTKEMAERNQTPETGMNQMGCQAKNHQRTGNSYTMDIVCNGADMKGEGKAKGTHASNQSFTSTYDFKGTMHGQPVTQRSETSGKWLSADCGTIKPVAEAMPRK